MSAQDPIRVSRPALMLILGIVLLTMCFRAETPEPQVHAAPLEADPQPQRAKEEPAQRKKALPPAFIEDFSLPKIATEVMKLDDAKVPYQVRRLKLKDAAPRSLRLAVSPAGSDDIG